MEFQVLDVVVSCNLLLGRPWIHAAKAVPSSLHQMVKFEWGRHEIVVHGEEDLSACNDTIVLFIEAKDDKIPWVYQTFEIVSVEKIPEGKCILGPKLSSASVMVANEMLKNGFVPGKGLGSSLQGIVHPVRPNGNPAFPHVKKKLRKFKTDMSVKIKEEITKQLTAKVIRVTRYPTWLANIVPVPKKDDKTRVCVDYRDLNKASSKDYFPLPNIHILIDNFAKHEIGSFVDCYARYH
ncbi:uncharacterized protein [Nicotiana sylvestris]|uniref:uncharacterized protein n=1 Tax=Nicotiana sylvestris TaxID=4096 RepID=UPI00388CE8E2